MKLQVSVLEARGLAAADANGLSDPFVRLQLGDSKARTSVVYKDLNPTWNEDFVFVVEEELEELHVVVWDEDRFTDDFLGQVRIPVASVLDADKNMLSRVWYPLQKRSEKSKTTVSGEICLSLSTFGRRTSGRKLTAMSTIKIPSVMEDSLAVSRIAEEKQPSQISRMSSMSSDSSVDSAQLVDISMTPSMHTNPDNLSEADQYSDDVSEMSNQRAYSSEPSADMDLINLHENFKPRGQRRSRRWKGDAQRMANKISSVFKKGGKHDTSVSPSMPGSPQYADSQGRNTEFSLPTVKSDDIDQEEAFSLSFFDDDGISEVASAEEIPSPLAGGVLLDQNYGISAKALNAVIFRPGSTFVRDLNEVQKSTDYVEEPWRKVGGEPIKRVISYTKAASKLVKALKATEVQMYTRNDEKCFSVLVTCATPDAPYGGNFVVEVQITISTQPDLHGGGKSCHLEISYRVNFLHSTMMKGMIENGVRTGVRETYSIYKEVLGRYAEPLSPGDSSSASFSSSATGDEERPVSDWEIAWEYFGKWHVLLALASISFIIMHMFLAPSRPRVGLDFWGINFPSSVTELITSAIVVIQVEQVVIMAFNFLRSRYWQSGDHGLKAHGNGWLTTVTLIEGENISPTDSGTANPYVVFTCSGEARTSSVKLRTSHPSWREIFEFNATEDPPSTMDVEVLDYDGPFAEAESLGHAEINFLKKSPGDLSDFWIPLSGKNARAHGSKLHLRVFLTNTRDGDALPDYLERVEREVGLKVNKRSAQRNTNFQKLFSLPVEEFLINDFACAIKRKILIQGRLFLSVRLLGFYSNLFGHKTKFALLWEEIEEIKETAQSINPSIVIFLRKGRGFDARHGARGIDGRGRLKFQFLSFVRSGTAFRTIVALWKNRNLSPEQKLDIIASVEAGDMKYAVSERQKDSNEPFLAVEEASMSEVVSRVIPISAESVLGALNNSQVDLSIHEKLGLVDYTVTPWEHVEEKIGAHRRRASYSLNRQISQFGTKVTCIQQQTVSDDLKKLVINEILTLHDVPFGEYFEVHERQELETLSLDPVNTQVKAFVGVVWHKSTEAQRKITKNIYEHMTKQIQEHMDITVAVVLQESDAIDKTVTGF